MKTEILQVHSNNPQKRLISHIAKVIISGGVIVIPTDSGFSIVTSLDNKIGIDRIRKIRKLSKRHDFTLMLESFNHIGEFAKMNNDAFRLMKRVLPGAYTFILGATRQVQQISSSKEKNHWNSNYIKYNCSRHTSRAISTNHQCFAYY